MDKTNFTPPNNKKELLDLIVNTRSEVLHLISRMSNEQIECIPGFSKNRSVKDLLSHLSWWEIFMIQRVLMIKANIESHSIIEPSLNRETDELNEQVFIIHRDLPLNIVVQDFELGIEKLKYFLDSLTWEEIMGGLNYKGEPIAYLIAGNTFDHYLHHLKQLKRYLDSLKEQNK